MKRLVVILVMLAAGWWTATPTYAVEAPLSQRYRGRFLILADQRGQAWYVHPSTRERYFLRDADGCFQVAQGQTLGITDTDLARLDRRRDARLLRRLAGRFLIGVQQHGRIWYLNPTDLRRYPIADGSACLDLVKRFGRGITTRGLRQIPMNTKQLVFDHTFDQVASVRLVNGKLEGGPYADHVLPIASLTKLMTALVILDLEPDWQRTVTVTAEDLAYPRSFVDPGDITSEIPFQVGQTVTIHDLWTAMILASSNQAAGMLAKHSGLSGAIFIAAMNAKAQRLGMTATAFTESSGLDPANVSTATDVAKLAAAAFAVPEITLTSVLSSATIIAKSPTGTPQLITVVNRNASLLNFGVDAAKTGFLYEAQRTVVVRKGPIVAVVLHARSMRERNELLGKLLQDPAH